MQQPISIFSRRNAAVFITYNCIVLLYCITVFIYCIYYKNNCLQCFDAVGWAAGRASCLSETEWWGAGMVICLERSADLHMAQLMPLPLTVSCFSKILYLLFTNKAA